MDLDSSCFHDVPPTDDELDAAAKAIAAAEEEWANLAFLATPKMPCPECGGTGRIYAGSLGETCPGCGGARAVDMPQADGFDGPDFASLRRAIGAYTVAQKDAELPAGHIAKKFLALPAPATIVRASAVTELIKIAKTRALSLPSRPDLQLPEARKTPRGALGAGEYSDADLDAMEDETYTDDDLDALEDKARK